ncbi:helix-turn-helix domain-containing protein [Streptomyces zagrosensis]|uniref:Transcriptional regulator with XRE-family HTH domain n=1 Tax=Streptomyces zagrosensis TaxID=1042984 RepID=A0A7W9V2L3_9ACTN|nr:helix-turn-helix transcriptional regulator [Streptomyces zagrosensis]MBB5940428.1 transcriptional regulator with XRE-family HTH domain [Streptomyces zagrosensis]
MQRGLSVSAIAEAIREHCSVSRLRAHRLARGKTLREVADELRQLAGPHGPRPDKLQLGHWETGDHSPRPAVIELLARHYDCSLMELGFDSPMLTAHTEPSARDVRAVRPVISHPDEPGATFEGRLDAARRLTDRTLATSSTSSAQLDVLEERVHWASQQYVYTPPEPMLGDLLELLDEVRSLAMDRQPASVQTRLSEQTALLATLIADSLMKLGLLAKARAWYGTARTAADDSGLIEIRARVRAQAAMLPFYYGPIEAAVALTREAHLLTRGRPTATAAFAAAAQARALAKLGDTRGAQDALRHATTTFERCDPGLEDHAFSFPERRLMLYQSGTYTALGLTSQARHVQDQALSQYPARTGIDPTLLRLETAIGLARDHSTAEACQLAGSAYLQVAPDHRTTIVEQRAREVITALPPAIRTTRAAKELNEILALPPGQK